MIRDGEGYRLNREQVAVDLWQLHDAALEADTTSADDRAPAWRRVTELYTGTLAEGWTYGWLDSHREAARRIVVDAFAALADQQPDTGQATALLCAALRVGPVNNYVRTRLQEIRLTTIGDSVERQPEGPTGGPLPHII